MYYIAKAKNILFTLFCCCILLSNVAYAQDKSQTAPPPNLPSELFDNTPLTPTKVFDNLYCIGTNSNCVLKSTIFLITSSCTLASRTTPFLPTLSFPASN